MDRIAVLSVLLLIRRVTTTPVYQQFNSMTCLDLPDGIMISSPFQCDKFYVCGGGSLSNEATCPPGMLFSPDSQGCDFPENVDCRDVPLPPWAEDPEEPTDPENTEEPTDPGDSEEPTDPDEPEEPNNPDRCPSEDPEYPVFLPALNDCSSYILCFHGREILMSCPGDHHWNAETMACDDPANVNCEANESFDCPSKGFDFLPHPDNCRRFIYCRDGFVRLQMCSFLKVFDSEEKTCVFGTTC